MPTNTNAWKTEAERRAKGYWTAWQKFPIAMGLGHVAAGVFGWFLRAIIAWLS